MSYTVLPGLYALGRPDRGSSVLVTANYKMSFDRLRAALPGRDAWILVLDTRGINVWCAAGKGTFGTSELVARVLGTELHRLVDHRELILPQLGGPGVAAHRVERDCGFSVVWGPIRAEDLPAFLDGGREAGEAMRRKAFPIGERAALVPMEIVPALKWLLLLLPLVFVLGGLGAPEGFRAGALHHGLLGVAGLLAGLLAGAVLTPLLLPWLPGRAFSVKGLAAGLALTLALAAVRIAGAGRGPTLTQGLELAAWVLVGTALAAFLAMNFTGSSTYTSLSGVKREMRVAVPAQVTAASAGLTLWIGARVLDWWG
jgi:acetyl-CoA decarbonylase/synthase complex subunit gamma